MIQPTIHIRNGFSLVELSIVLVILGLLVGGILSGQSLIHAAELRGVTTEYTKWITGARTFRDKYFALPGDINNATSFWGAATCPGTSADTTAAGKATCNGDGDGMITTGNATVANETYRFWQHLANAGLIEGSFTGVSNGTYSVQTVDATDTPNVPMSKLKGPHWNIQWFGVIPYTDGSYFDGNYGNAFRLGIGTAGTYQSMKPEDSWNIDTKLDDGMPGTGNVLTVKYLASATPALACTTPVTTTSSSIAASSTYVLSNSNIVCSMMFKTGF